MSSRASFRLCTAGSNNMLILNCGVLAVGFSLDEDIGHSFLPRRQPSLRWNVARNSVAILHSCDAPLSRVSILRRALRSTGAPSVSGSTDAAMQGAYNVDPVASHGDWAPRLHLSEAWYVTSAAPAVWSVEARLKGADRHIGLRPVSF
jgi:hypothetical protein